VDAARATLWTDYRAAGGERLGSLPLVEGTEKTGVDGQDLTSITVPKARWTELGGDIRFVVRVDWPTGEVVERRVARVRTTDESPVIALECLPPFDDLSTGGPILRTVAGRVVTRVAGELPVREVLSTFVLPHLSAQRLGLAIGTIEQDRVVQFALDSPTPAELIRVVFEQAKLEAELERTSDTTYTLHGRRQRGSTFPTLQVRAGREQQRLLLGVDDRALATVVVPLGDADPITGDRATIATARWSVSLIDGTWLRLRDPGDATLTPIAVDSQWVNAWVLSRDGFAQRILASRVSDGAVEVGSAAGLSVNSRVWIAADSDGTPLAEVYDASAVGPRRRTVPLPLAGVRGEANELRNGRFLNGLDQWTAVNPTSPPAFAEIPRAEMGVTRSGTAAAPRAANTGTGTPLAVQGLPANSVVRQSAEIIVEGVTLAVTADTIPSTTGALTLPIDPVLPATYPNGTPFTLLRREVRTLTLDGVQSPLSPVLQFQDSNTDGLSAGITGTLVSTDTVYSSAPGATVGLDAYVGPTLAGAARLRVSSPPTNLGALGWATANLDVYTLGEVTLTYTPGATTGTVTYGSASGTPVVGTRVRYFGQTTQFQLLRVTAISGATLTVVSDDGLPIIGWSGAGVWSACNVLLANGSTWTFTAIRETRTLLTSGTQSAGASSLVAQAQANIATRQFTTSDTVSLPRPLSGSLAITGLTSTTGFDDDLGNPIIGMQAVVTYDAATSTIDDLTPGVDWSGDEVQFNLGTVGTWALRSIGSGSAVLENPLLFITPTPFTVPQTASASWIRSDVYPVTAGASWSGNGRVVVPVSVPAGRSYARGLAASANWSAGFLRLHAAVTGPASSVELFGHDGFASAPANPAGALRGAVYRVPASGSTLPVAGNVLYAASTVQADGAGAASVPLVAANPNAIAAGQGITIHTPDLLRPTDPRTGSVVRLTSPVGGPNVPTGSTPGLTPIGPVTIPVPPGSTVPIAAFVTVALSQGTYQLGQQPAIALVTDGGVILTAVPLAVGAVQAAQTPTIVRLIARVTLAETTAVSVRIYGGSIDRSLVTVALDAMLCVTDRTDVPFVIGSWANTLALRGADELAQRRDPAVSVTVDVATLRRWSDAPPTTPVVLGQSVHLPAYGLTRRVLTIERSLLDPDRLRVDVGIPSFDLTTRVGTE
jgi:hypothetical protein